MMRILFLFAGWLLPHLVLAQAIDNTFAYKDIGDRYLRINYENDYFSARDRFYTQGLLLEYAAPFLQRNPLNKLLPHPGMGKKQWAVAIEQDAYTPTSIQARTILYGDRPYAASLLIKSSVINIEEKYRLSGTLSLGISGAAAGGEFMQTTIHENTANVIPQGWQYQIHTDIAINYQLNYERRLAAIKKYLLLNGDVMARAGTLSDKIAAGVTLMGGYFDTPPGNSREKRWRIYAYDRPAINAIGYDATLEGGLFNRSSPYVIAPGDISGICFENRFGIVLNYQRVCLEYFQSYLTREFKTQAGNHRWGGIQIAVSL